MDAKSRCVIREENGRLRNPRSRPCRMQIDRE
jgi:hypothetical protein